jgi:hypothetical protein
MSSATEYREYATQCVGWAKIAKTDQERDIFLQMAKSWMDAALIARAREVPPLSPALTKPPSDRDGNATAQAVKLISGESLICF